MPRWCTTLAGRVSPTRGTYGAPRRYTETTTADESTTGPASFIIIDPDGNPIFVDQHV